MNIIAGRNFCSNIVENELGGSHAPIYSLKFRSIYCLQIHNLLSFEQCNGKKLSIFSCASTAQHFLLFFLIYNFEILFSRILKKVKISVSTIYTKRIENIFFYESIRWENRARTIFWNNCGHLLNVSNIIVYIAD